MNAQHLLVTLSHAQHDLPVVAIVDGDAFPVTHAHVRNGRIEISTDPEPRAKPAGKTEAKAPAPAAPAAPATPTATEPDDETVEFEGDKAPGAAE